MTDEPKLKDVEMEEFLSVCEGECEHPYCWAKKSGGLAASPVVQSESERCPKFWERIQCRLESGHEQPHQFDHTKPVVQSEPAPYAPNDPLQLPIPRPDMLPSRESTLPELDELLKAAKAADEPYLKVDSSSRPMLVDREFRAKANPAAIIELISAITAARAQVADLKQENSQLKRFAPRWMLLASGATHWEGCWEDHRDCAIARIGELAAEVEKMKQQLANRARSLASENQGLRDELALLQQQEPRWRSVETELPPIDPALLATQDWWKESSLVEAWGDVTSFGDDIMLAHYDWSDGKWFDQHGENFAIQGITYWRPIDLVPPEGTDYGLYPSQVATRKTASPAPYAPPEKETGG